MRRWSTEAFITPGDTAHGGPLDLVVTCEDGEHVIEGFLKAADDNWFPILDGVPCFLSGALRPPFAEFARRHGLALPNDVLLDANPGDQALTAESFSFKWSKFQAYGDRKEEQDFLMHWYCRKFGLADIAALRAFYRDRGRVLEVGPGSGFNTRFIAQNCSGKVFALDISAAAVTTFAKTWDLPNCTVVQADLMKAPFPDRYFDFIIADGVLHHTPNAERSLRALFEKLMPGGQMFFYVYRKMGAARQFCDQYIRDRFSKMTADECLAACRPITAMGRELSKLNAKITLEQPIEVLGIPAGTHAVQRLFYYNFVKCFWNDAFDFEYNNMVNFDWYNPHTASQHTEDEVRGWLDALGVTEYAVNDANPNGISVLFRCPLREAGS